MKKRLLFAILFSVAVGGMFYQLSWSQDKPDPPADVDPETGPQEGFCLRHPERCPPTIPPRKIPPPELPVEAPGQDVDPETGPQEGFCLRHPERCVTIPPRKIPPPDRPVEAPGQELLP